jgi:hypothetical protein
MKKQRSVPPSTLGDVSWLGRALTGGSTSSHTWPALFGLALEEQCLTGNGRNDGGLERLGNEKRRFGALSRQQALRMGGNENDRCFE